MLIANQSEFTGKHKFLQPVPEHAANREEHADADCAFEGENHEHPFESTIAAQRITQRRDDEHAERLHAAVAFEKQREHPQALGKQRDAPERRPQFTQIERAWIGALRDLLDAEVPFADHELPELEENPEGSEKQKRRHAADGNGEPGGALEETARKSETNSNEKGRPTAKGAKGAKRREDRISED